MYFWIRLNLIRLSFNGYSAHFFPIFIYLKKITIVVSFAQLF